MAENNQNSTFVPIGTHKGRFDDSEPSDREKEVADAYWSRFGINQEWRERYSDDDIRIILAGSGHSKLENKLPPAERGAFRRHVKQIRAHYDAMREDGIIRTVDDYLALGKKPSPFVEVVDDARLPDYTVEQGDQVVAALANFYAYQQLMIAIVRGSEYVDKGVIKTILSKALGSRVQISQSGGEDYAKAVEMSDEQWMERIKKQVRNHGL